MEARQRGHHKHQIFKEPKKAWGMAFGCTLSKSLHHAKSVKLSTQKPIYHSSHTIIKDINFNTLATSNPPLLALSVGRKKQNP